MRKEAALESGGTATDTSVWLARRQQVEQTFHSVHIKYSSVITMNRSRDH